MTTVDLAPPPLPAPAVEDCAVIELRDYRLRPSQRDVLIELFEREFVESQEALGMRVLGQFRDLDRPDHFVWLRGFADMPERKAALEAFYDGPVWKRHRDVANATMLDSDNVRLLRYAKPAWALATPPLPRPRAGSDAAAAPAAAYLLTLCSLPAPAGAALARCFECDALPVLRECGAMPCAVLQTEPAPNNFPRLPVRSGEHLLAWIARLPDTRAADDALRRLAACARWTETVLPRLHRGERPRTLRLQPTGRSLLR